MLQRFGEHIRGWFAGIVIGVIALAFVIWGLQYYISNDKGPGAVVAVADGVKINEQAFENNAQLAMSHQGQSLGRALTAKEQQFVHEMVLHQMIQQAVLSKAFQQMGLSVSPQVIQQVIEGTPAFQVNGKFDSDLLQRYLASSGQSIDAVVSVVEHKMLMAQLTDGVAGSAFITPSVRDTLFGLWQAQRSFRYTTLPLVNANQIKVTPAQVTAYYNSHKAAYTLPESVQVQYILLSKDSLGRVDPTEAEAKAYYDQHQDNFKTAMQWKISRITTKNEKAMQALQARLKSGASFQSLVKSPEKDWQVVTQTLNAVNTAPALINVLKQLPNNGVSQPLSTPAGPTIMQLLATKPATTKPFADVKQRIMLQLKVQRTQQAMSRLSDKVANLAYTQPNSLDPIVKETGLNLQQSPLFSRDQATGIFKQPPVLDAIFSASVLKDGNNSQPISLDNGSVMVLRVIKHQPSRVKALADVKSDVTKALQQETALRQLGLKAYDIQKALNQGKTPSSLTWKTVASASRMDKSIDPAILSQAFQLPKGRVAAIQQKNQYVIIQTLSVKPASWAQADAKQKTSFQKMLTQWQGQVEMSLYLKSLFKQAKVKIHDKKLASSWSM